jgi:hypothetical protein
MDIKFTEKCRILKKAIILDLGCIQNMIKISKEFLLKEYIRNKKSTYMIAKILKCTKTKILYWMKKYNIKRRTSTASIRLNIRYGPDAGGYRHGRSLLKRYCKDCHKLLKRGIHKFCASCAAITHRKKFWKTKQGKKLRERLSRMFKGKNNPNYKHGLSSMRYNHIFLKIKPFIRKRDDYTCQHCGIKERKYKKLFRKNLDIHHIDYNKFNCVENNLVTLCRFCNNHANKDRDYWFAYFTYLIEKE